jgi:hypothetical protein
LGSCCCHFARSRSNRTKLIGWFTVGAQRWKLITIDHKTMELQSKEEIKLGS